MTDSISPHSIDTLMDVYNRTFGDIMTHSISTIYDNVYHELLWIPEKVIELLEELYHTYSDEFSMSDDPFTHKHIITQIKYIESFIEMLEFEMV